MFWNVMSMDMLTCVALMGAIHVSVKKTNMIK